VSMSAVHPHSLLIPRIAVPHHCVNVRRLFPHCFRFSLRLVCERRACFATRTLACVFLVPHLHHRRQRWPPTSPFVLAPIRAQAAFCILPKLVILAYCQSVLVLALRARLAFTVSACSSSLILSLHCGSPVVVSTVQ
jgi:hypothetical protein